jgi:TonB family protein
MRLILIFIFCIPLVLFSQEEQLELPKNIHNNDKIVADQDTLTIVDYPDVEAQFPGGSTEMMKYLIKNFKYPDCLMAEYPYGRIFIEFTVNIDGSIEQVKLIKGVSNEIDKEAFSLVKEMPQWKPAKHGKDKVRSRIKINIEYTLKEDKK